MRSSPPKYDALAAAVFKLQKCIARTWLLFLVLHFVIVKLRFIGLGLLARQPGHQSTGGVGFPKTIQCSLCICFEISYLPDLNFDFFHLLSARKCILNEFIADFYEKEVHIEFDIE